MRCGHSWLNPKLEVRTSTAHQNGVFARESVSAGERLAIFGGDVMFIDEINDLPQRLQGYTRIISANVWKAATQDAAAAPTEGRHQASGRQGAGRSQEQRSECRRSDRQFRSELRRQIT